jgi:hypothetical protein
MPGATMSLANETFDAIHYEPLSFRSLDGAASITLGPGGRVGGAVRAADGATYSINVLVSGEVKVHKINNGVSCGNSGPSFATKPTRGKRGDTLPQYHRDRRTVNQWWGQAECYPNDETTRSFTIGVAVGNNAWTGMKGTGFESSWEIAEFEIARIFHDTNTMIYTPQINLVLTIGEIVVSDGDGTEEYDGNCIADVDIKLKAFDNWVSTLEASKRKYGLWHLFDDCLWNDEVAATVSVQR